MENTKSAESVGTWKKISSGKKVDNSSDREWDIEILLDELMIEYNEY